MSGAADDVTTALSLKVPGLRSNVNLDLTTAIALRLAAVRGGAGTRFQRFGGVDGRIACGTGTLNTFLQGTPFTIECWVNDAVMTADVALVCAQMTGPSGKGIQLGIAITDGKGFLRVQGDFRLQRKMDVVLASGSWAHLAVTYDGSGIGAGIAFYLNGVATPSTITNENLPGDMTSTNQTYLGARNATEVPYTGDLRDVRIWKGMQVHVSQIAANKAGTSVLPGYTLFDAHASKFAANANQGVATDGTHIYAAADAAVVKHDLVGATVATFTHGISGFKNEDPCVVAGVLIQPLTNHATEPRAGKIQKITTATMLQSGGTIDLAEAIWPASVAEKDGVYWVSVTESATLYKYNASFVLQGTATFPVLGTQDATWPGYAGLMWIGDFLYGNKHETAGRGIDVCQLVGGVLVAVGSYAWVSSGTTQGCAYDSVNSKVYWAARGHSNAVYESGLTGGLIGYWKLDEAAGPSYADSSPVLAGNNTGTSAGNVTTPAVSGGAAQPDQITALRDYYANAGNPY